MPSLFVPATAGNTVGKEPSNVPGLPTSSVSVTVSTSPVSTFVTCTVSVPFPARSASVTNNESGSPTFAATIEGTPVTPPAGVSCAL